MVGLEGGGGGTTAEGGVTKTEQVQTRGGGGGGGGEQSQKGVLPKSNKCKQGRGGYRFWSFCDNVIIE